MAELGRVEGIMPRAGSAPAEDRGAGVALVEQLEQAIHFTKRGGGHSTKPRRSACCRVGHGQRWDRGEVVDDGNDTAPTENAGPGGGRFASASEEGPRRGIVWG